MNKFCVLFFTLFSFVTLAYAQNENYVENRDIDKMRQEMREFKLKYLAKEIELKDSQKKEFTEIYDELESKRAEIYRPVRDLERKIRKEGNNVTEEEYQKLTEEKNKAEQENSKLEKKYNERFSRILSQKQIYKLKESENNFRVKLEIMRQQHKKDKHAKKQRDSKSRNKKKNLNL